MSSDEKRAPVRRRRAIKQPQISPGPLADLKALLYELYLQAGLPTLDQVAAWITADQQATGAPGRDTVARIIGGTGMPASQADVTTVAAVLARAARWDARDAEQRARDLWVTARMANAQTLSTCFPVSQAGQPLGAPGMTLRLAPRPAFLTGREMLLAELDARLAGGSGPRLAVLCGLGGAGKTSVAVEYAHRHLAEVDVCWQFAAEDPSLLEAEFSVLAAQLGARDAPGPQDPVASVHSMLARFPAGWLLVFDNAVDRASLERFIPPAGNGRVLVTTQSQHWPRGQALDVPPLETDVAADFLVNRTGDPDQVAALGLAAALDGLPLALEQAAAYMQATGIRLTRPDAPGHGTGTRHGPSGPWRRRVGVTTARPGGFAVPRYPVRVWPALAPLPRAHVPPMYLRRTLDGASAVAGEAVAMMTRFIYRRRGPG